MNFTNQKNEMSFLDHLEALRWHLIRILVVVAILGVWAFFNNDFVFDVVLFGPKRADFITYRWLCELSGWANHWIPNMVDANTLCIGQNFPKLQNLEMSGQFMAHMTISFIAGIIMAFPYVIWELWRFISPALTEREKKYSTGFIFLISLLFMLGVLFSYFLVAPLSVNFFLTYQVSEEIQTIPQLSSYISIMTTLTLGCGLVFELPLLMYFLGKMGIITAAFLRTYRKHAIVIILIIAAVITPPDVFSQLLVTLPLLLLYEISIYVVKSVEAKP